MSRHKEKELVELQRKLIEINTKAAADSPDIAAYHNAKKAPSKAAHTVVAVTVDVMDEEEKESAATAPDLFSESKQRAIIIDLCEHPKHAIEYKLGNYSTEYFNPTYVSELLPTLDLDADKAEIIQNHLGLPKSPSAVTEDIPEVITGLNDVLRRGLFSKAKQQAKPQAPVTSEAKYTRKYP